MDRSRRAFLGFLAASPLVPLFWARGGTTRGASPIRRLPTAARDTLDLTELISSPDEALNVFDFEAVARAELPPAHYGYLATGVDGDATLRANREGFGKLQLRPRRLVDVSRVDTSLEIFGERWDTPIGIAPCGSQRAFHPQGEAAVARAARSRGHTQILSTVTTTSVEEVVEARGEPVWYQLYPTASWDVTRGLLRRAEGAGCRVVVLTVDLPVISNRETQQRYARADTRDCAKCHQPSYEGFLRRKPMFEGVDMTGVSFDAPHLTWEFLRRLRDETEMRLVVKGIVTREDAERCIEYGADGIIVSNHGGRAEESGRATIESLPEVVGGAEGRIPVLVDSGFRRGNDIIKALALGATAICIGRPYLWGLAAFGQPGVERVLDILRAELILAMKLAGTPSVADLDRTLAVGP
jgi:isopentenyl diphosphate isomerase/L-lactate dehydrogenase-like FMN-dependent dehydrogenase